MSYNTSFIQNGENWTGNYISDNMHVNKCNLQFKLSYYRATNTEYIDIIINCKEMH